MKQHVLELREDSIFAAVEMLGTYRTVYDNEGKEPDGSAWLPKSEIPMELMQQLVTANLGRIVEVEQWSDIQVIEFLAQSDFIVGDKHFFLNDEIIEPFAEEKTCAHYGVVGTPSSLWIVSDAGPYPPQTPEEKLVLYQLGMLFTTEQKEPSEEKELN